jgi:TonB family protein
MTDTLTFGAYAGAAASPRHWKASLAASSAIYVGLAIAAAGLGSATRHIVREKAIEVTFVEKVVAPPPPPAAARAVPPPPAAAPTVRPDQKIRRLDKPPPPKALVAPKEMPTQAPAEADPSEDKGVAVHGDGNHFDPAGLEGGSAAAIALPEEAIPPMPARTNAIPPYPQEARAAGRTGTVVLKVVILADGTVGKVEVMRGDEPFVSSALGTVKGWRYEPARFKGQAITVYRIIQIPFKLTA